MSENEVVAVGDVVIVGTGQAGTVDELADDIWVLLRNGDIWVGPYHKARHPQSQEDLDMCPIDVERLEAKRAPINRKED